LDPNCADALEVNLRRGAYVRQEAVIRDISFVLPSGAMLLIMGHNGAGKTTLLRAIAGLLPITDAEISLSGRQIRGGPVERMAMGLGFVAAGRHCFPRLTVRENFMVAGETRQCRGAEMNGRIDEVLALFPELVALVSKAAGQLSGGQQRMVALGIGLIQRPKVLLVDEPSLGLAPSVVNRVYEAVTAMRNEFGMSVVVVEQNVDLERVKFDELLMLRTGSMALKVERAMIPTPDELLAYF